jgi:hypothetical protein
VTAQAFRYAPSLPDLPKGAERSIIAQFKSVQLDLDSLRGTPKNSVPAFGGHSYNAKVGDFVMLEPPADGTLVMIPQGNADNVTARIVLVLVGGFLSPGVSVSIVGRKGTINGQDTLFMNSPRLVELVSVGDRGWFYST